FSSLLVIGLASPFEYPPTYQVSNTTYVHKTGPILLQLLQYLPAEFHKRILEQGIPKEAVKDFLELECHYTPLSREKFKAIQDWGRKWNNTDTENLEKLNFGRIEDFQSAVADEVSSVFANLHAVSVRVAQISASNTATLHDLWGILNDLNHISPLEADLFKIATKHMENKKRIWLKM
ncbi:hypothetical protein PFISCL1PPCAC_27667, partial [Pristionchus fissidentatus]